MKTIVYLLACMVCTASNAQYSLQRYDVNPGSITSSYPWPYIEAGGDTYFLANDGKTGREMWRLNGNIVENVTDIRPGQATSIISDFVEEMNGKLYFISLLDTGYQLCSFDIASKTVTPITIKAPKLHSIVMASNIIAIGAKLYFGVGLNQWAYNIYSYEPASSKTQRLTWFEGNHGIDDLTEYNGMLAFTYFTDSTGVEPGIYDPNTHTLITYDVASGTIASSPKALTVYDKQLYFTATTPAYGYELYKLSLQEGPVRITDIAPGPANSISTFGSIAGFNGSLIFPASATGSSHNLFKYNLRDKTVSQLSSFPVNFPNGPGSMAAYGGKLYISADSAGDHALYVYDGSNPPYNISKLLNGTEITYSFGLQVCNGKLFFSGSSAPYLDVEVHTLTDSAALAINNPSAPASAITIYPNPATSEAHISFTLNHAATMRVQLTDMQGRAVYASEVKEYAAGRQEIKIPVQQLATGGYIYSVSDAEGNVVSRGKLMKE